MFKEYKPSIHTYDAAVTANTRRKRINPKVSRLLAVTLFTPNRIVFNSLPCDVPKLCLKTYATHPLSVATMT